jgi:hypothetical protein
LNLLKRFLRSRLNLLFALLAVLTVAFASPPPSAMALGCTGAGTGTSGTVTYYSDATLTTVVGRCQKFCCWTRWACSGNTSTGYNIETCETEF